MRLRQTSRPPSAIPAIRLMLLLMAACLTVATGRAAEPPAAPNTEQSQPFPISLTVDTPITLVRHDVNFTGKTIALLNNDVSLDIEAPKAAPPQSSVLKSTAALDGKFSFRFTPTVAGLYTVVVTAPDHRGTSKTQFRAVDPASGTGDQDLPQAIPRLIRYVPQILDELVQKVDNLPPPPGDYVIPLVTDGDVIKGSQSFKNERTSSNGEAEGEYTAEFKICNPGC